MININLSITSQEAIDRISLFMDKSKFLWNFKRVGNKGFLGRIQGNNFFVYKRISYRNSFNPYLIGRIDQTDCGCNIQAEFKLNSFVRLFLIMWFAGIVFFFLLGFLVLLGGQLADSVDPKVFVVIAVPLVMLGGGIALVHYGRKIGKKEENVLRNAFLRLFDDVSLHHFHGDVLP